MRLNFWVLLFTLFFFSSTTFADDFFSNFFGNPKPETKVKKKQFYRKYNMKNPKSRYYLEPQSVTPERDKALLGQILKKPKSTDSVVNILFIAQDKPAPRSRVRKRTSRKKGGKRSAKALASRADILFVISLDKESKRWSFYSFYRGLKVPSYCQKINLDRGEKYLANYYFYMGRKGLLPCLEKMMNRRLKRHSELAQAINIKPGHFKFHAFFEGTKESTIKPLAKDIYSIATSPLKAYRLAKIYGFKGLEKALSVFVNKEKLSQNLQKALSGENVSKKDLRVDTRYLYVEAKERMAYKAGGYQRSFNFARMIADFMAWVGYAVYYDPTIYKIFEPAFNKNFSRSHSLKGLMDLVRTEDGENALKYVAKYKNDLQPIDLVQFGPSMSYRAFSEGQWSGSSFGPLRDLIFGKAILPSAPTIDTARLLLD